MTKKKYSDKGNLEVVEFPPINIVPTMNKIKTQVDQELHLIQIDDGYKPKSIFVNRSWNKDIKDRS